ncbi:hypothetical protein GCM10010971_10590 [Silvimonas amylolytica]|uniref:Uncharacterized protein n=1 Tax=Silvimonas amylolytica TaxID=449663 RepID=A0ABQ2PIS4_9NEIS|nr:hypothetical protein GCM10010971_10590 [Silvimonas amylolytica]
MFKANYDTYIEVSTRHNGVVPEATRCTKAECNMTWSLLNPDNSPFGGLQSTGQAHAPAWPDWWVICTEAVAPSMMPGPFFLFADKLNLDNIESVHHTKTSHDYPAAQSA